MENCLETVQGLAKDCVNASSETEEPLCQKEKEGIKYCGWLSVFAVEDNLKTGDVVCPFADSSVVVFEKVVYNANTFGKGNPPVNKESIIRHPGCKYKGESK